jgi:hypothetical protein
MGFMNLKLYNLKTELSDHPVSPHRGLISANTIFSSAWGIIRQLKLKKYNNNLDDKISTFSLILRRITTLGPPTLTTNYVHFVLSLDPIEHLILFHINDLVINRMGQYLVLWGHMTHSSTPRMSWDLTKAGNKPPSLFTGHRNVLPPDHGLTIIL